MTMHGKRYLPALALATLVLAACDNGTRMAKSQFTTAVPETPTLSSTEPTVETPTPEPTATLAPPTTPRTSRPPATSPPPSTKPPPAGNGSSGSPLPVGAGHSVGPSYRVAITSVNLNADAAMEAANEFNDPPHGRYVLVGLSVQYLGDEEGSPWIELSESFVGSDARQYDSNACAAVVARPGIFEPTLEHGGRSHFQICFDVPPSAIPRAKIFLEETFAFEGPRVYWQTR